MWPIPSREQAVPHPDAAAVTTVYGRANQSLSESAWDLTNPARVARWRPPAPPTGFLTRERPGRNNLRCQPHPVTKAEEPS
jgi:hypothetical protein